MSDLSGTHVAAPPPAASGVPMSAAETVAHNARAAAESAARGFRHWMVIGAGLVVLLVVHFAVR